jgi:hypothetical protein
MDPINAGINFTAKGEFKNQNNAAASAGFGEFARAVVNGSSFEEASSKAGIEAKKVADSWPSNSSEPTMNKSSNQAPESSISEASNKLNRVNRELEENERTHDDYIEGIAESDKQLAALESRANELMTRINNGSTPNREKDLGELRYIMGADYKGGAIHGNREGEKWTNNSGKEISGEYYKLLNDRNKLASLAESTEKRKSELESIAIENEENLTFAFQRSLSHKLAGNSEIQAAYKIFSLRPRYEVDRKEREDVRIESLNLINTFSDVSEFGPTVRMIAEAEGVDPKIMNNLVSDVNKQILSSAFHLAKETAMISAAGTAFRVAGLFAEAPMIVKALNLAGDFSFAPPVESLAWIAGKIGYGGLSTELTVLASEAAKQSLKAEIRIAKILTGGDGLALLVKETTQALANAASNYEKIADKTSKEGLAAYKEYKQAYELSKIAKRETMPIVTQFSKESQEALAELQLAQRSLFDSAKTTLEAKAVQRSLEQGSTKLIITEKTSRITPTTRAIQGKLGRNQQVRTFMSQATDRELNLQRIYNEARAERIQFGTVEAMQREKKALNDFYEELEIRFNSRFDTLRLSIDADRKSIEEIRRLLTELKKNNSTNTRSIIDEMRKSKLFSEKDIGLLEKNISTNDIVNLLKKCSEKVSHINHYEFLVNQINNTSKTIKELEYDLENFFSKCKHLRGGIGGRSDVNDFFRTFMGKSSGEHPYTVEEFIESIYNGMFRGHIPNYSEAVELSRALKTTVTLDVETNQALNRLVIASNNADKIGQATTYEGKLRAAFESLNETDKKLINAYGAKNSEGPIIFFIKQREEAAKNIVIKLIEANKSLKSKYIDGFIEDIFKKWKGRENFNLEKNVEESVGGEAFKKYKSKSTDELFIEAQQVAKKSATIPAKPGLSAGLGSRNPINQARRPISILAEKSRGFASIPTPPDVRYAISEIMDLTEGPALKRLIPPQKLEELGLNKPGLRIPVIKEIVFRHLCSEGKIRGAQAWEIELARIKLAIASTEVGKASATKTATLEALRKKEAELISKNGELRSGPRPTNNTLAAQGDNLDALEEQTAYSWASKASESKSAVQATEDAAAKAGKGTTEKLLNKANATAEQSENAKRASSIGDSKVKKDAEAVSAKAASSTSEAVLEREVLTAGRGLPSKLELPGSTPAQVSSATDEAASLYSRVFGKADKQPLVSADKLASERRLAEGTDLVPLVIDPSKNATSFIEAIKAYTPYGMSLRSLTEMLSIGARNIQTFGVVARNLVLEGRSIAAYNEFVENGLKVILENASGKQVAKLITVFTPQRLIEFKSAMASVFSYSHMHASQILNIMVTKIIPGSKYNEALIDALIQIMRSNPANALAETNKLAAGIIAEEIKTGAAAAQAAAKGTGWFKIKSYYSLLIAGGGASVLFLANLANTPDLKTLAEKVSDTGEDLKSELEKNPSYQRMEELSREIRERILVDLLGQVPPPPPAPTQAAREEWSDSLMKSLGYNPDKAEDRREFAKMAQVVKNTAAAAATAAAVAAATALAKAAVSAAVGK